MSTIRTITVDELATAIRANDIDQFWNVLTTEYFGGELIPGSRWVPLDTVARHTTSLQLPKDTRIVVYCSGPTCPNSADAARKLETLGFTNIRLFEGGLESWRTSGRGVETLKLTQVA